MSDQIPEQTSEPASKDGSVKAVGKSRLPGRIGTGLTIGGLVVALGLGGLYIGRRAVAEEVLVGWLHRRGIAADVEVQRIEWDGFTGRITVGDPENPDVRVERVEVDYLIGMPWMAGGLGVTPRRVLLDRPVIKAEWTGKKVSFGSLDPLIEEFTSRPPGPKKPGPLIIVNQGTALLTTPYGAITATADARVNDERLEWLKASLNPADLKLNDLEAKGLDARIEARGGRDSLDFTLVSSARSLQASGTTGEKVSLDLKGQLPYPRKGEAKAVGTVTLDAKANVERIAGDQIAGRGVNATLGWKGQLDGWIDAFTLNGQGSLKATADSLASGDQQLTAATLIADSVAGAFSRGQPGQSDSRLNWRLEGPTRLRAASLRSGQTVVRQADLSSGRLLAGGDGKLFEAQGPLTLAAQTLDSGDLKLRDVRGQFRLDAVRGLATRVALQGGLAANGQFMGLGDVTREDAPQMARLKQAARNFRFSAPNLTFAQTNRGNALQLTAPAQVVSANGARLTFQPKDGPLLQLAGGAPHGSARLTLEGEGFPKLNVDVSQWQMADGGFSARLSGDGALDFDPVSGIALKTAGRLRVRNGTTDYTADGCADLRAASVDIGENDLKRIQGQLCAEGQPLFTMRQGQWQLAGRLQQTQLAAPFAGIDLDNGRGRLVVAGRQGQTTLRLTGIEATLADIVADSDAQARFNPALAKGEVVLANGIWSGNLALSREGYHVADLVLDHRVASGEGGLRVHTGPLDFTAGGLQPTSLSPMLSDFVGSPATGRINLSGQFRWNPQGATSDGKLYVEGMTFDTPMGQVSDLSGQVAFTDLLNMTMAEDAVFTARRLDAFLPVENLNLRARTRDRALVLSEAAVSIGGGRVRASSVVIPFARGQDVTGVMHLENLQVNDLLAAANLRDKASFQAALTGDIGFRYNEKLGWQIESGELTSNEGRLEIDPDVLTGMSAGGGELTTDVPATVELPPNAMQDLAYQALENLAIDSLKAEVQSQPGGRLGIKFVIDGRHDPAVRKELRVSLFDLLRGDFMKKRLDLPSGTPVILTLNTSWNANELATEIFNVMRRRFEDQQASAPPAITVTSPDGTP